MPSYEIPSAPQHVVLSGYLEKMKKEPRMILPQWNRRWVTIEDLTLRWRASETTAATTISGEIPLKGITSVQSFESGSKGAFSFVIESPQRTLVLRAATKEEKAMWMDSLTMNIDLAKGGEGTGAVSREATSSHPKKLEDHTIEGELAREDEKLQSIEAAVESKEAHGHSDEHKAQHKEHDHDAKGDDKKH